MTALVAQHRASLDGFLQVARQINDHSQAAEGHLAAFREQFAALLAGQEAGHRRMTEAVLVSLDGLLARVEKQLPDVMRSGVKEGLSETVKLLEALREQAAALAQTIAQVSGNADRQLLAYERWQERANAAQARLEASLAGYRAGLGPACV